MSRWWYLIFPILLLTILLITFLLVGLSLEAQVAEQRHRTLRRQLNEASSRLASMDIDHFIDFGTLLGHIRERDVLPQDIDIDIGLVYAKDDRSRITSQIQDAFHHDYHILPYDEVLKTFLKTNTNMSLDFYWYDIEEDDDGTLWATRPTKHIRHRFTDIFPTKRTTFGNYTFPVNIPAHPEAILLEKYGETWRTPIYGEKGKNQPGSRKSSVYHAFERSVITWRDLTGIQKPVS